MSDHERILDVLPTSAEEPDHTWCPTAWDIAEATGLDIGQVRACLYELEAHQQIVVSSHQTWGHTELFYSRPPQP